MSDTTESLREQIDALKRERVAYYRALSTEGAEVVRRVTRIVLDTRAQIPSELSEALAAPKRLEAAERESDEYARLWQRDAALRRAAERLAEAAGRLISAEASRVMGYPQTYRGEINALHEAIVIFTALAREETAHEHKS